MATQIPSMTVVAVNASNVVLGAGGTAGTAVRQRQMVLRAVSSGGKVIESDGIEGSVNANPPVIAVRVVDASNAILDSGGSASASTAKPDTVAMFVGSDGVGYGSSGSGVPVMDVHIVDETSTLLDALFGGSPYSSEAQQFFDRVSAPGTTRSDIYATLIDGLVSDGLWAKCEALYILAAADAATALTNLKSSSFGATAVASPTFTADHGYTFADPKYLDTNFSPSTGTIYLQNSASFGAWDLSTTTGTIERLMGVITGSPQDHSSQVLADAADNNCYCTVNDNTNTFATVANGGTAGFWMANRSAAGALQLYKNGSSVVTGVTASSGRDSGTFFIGSTNAAGTPYQGCTAQIGAAWIGGSLDATQAGNLHTRLSTYLTAVGAL